MKKKTYNEWRAMESVKNAIAAHDHLVRSVKEASREAKVAEEALDAHTEAQQVLQSLAQKVQEHAHDKIARIVTKCIRIVFDDEPYDFRINFERKRGKTEARLCFVKDGVVLEDPMHEVSGGILDVAAFALRLASLILTKPSSRPVLILDEPFKHVSPAERREKVKIMLNTLARDLGVQIIMSTNIDDLATGKVIDLS